MSSFGWFIVGVQSGAALVLILIIYAIIRWMPETASGAAVAIAEKIDSKERQQEES